MCVSSYCAFQKHANSEVQKPNDAYIFLLLSIISADLLRLVFTSDRVGVISGVIRALMTWWKSKIQVVSKVISVMESESKESECFHFFRPRLRLRHLRSAWSSENQIVRVGSRSGRINQSQCTFPRYVIDIVLPLLLPTPTIWFSLDHKRNISDGAVRGIGMLFSLDISPTFLIMTPTLSLVKTSL